MNKLSFILFISLLSCSVFGAVDFVKKLAARIITPASFDKTELQKIVECDDLEAFKKLYARFPDIINAKIGSEDSLIFCYGLYCGSKEIAGFILTCPNFELNACDDNGNFPLMVLSLKPEFGIDLFRTLCQLPGINPDIKRKPYDYTTLNWVAKRISNYKKNLREKTHVWAGYGSKEQAESILNFLLQALELLLRIVANPYHKDNYCGKPIDNVPDEIKEICQKIRLEYKPEVNSQLRGIANIPEEVSEIVLDYFI